MKPMKHRTPITELNGRLVRLSALKEVFDVAN